MHGGWTDKVSSTGPGRPTQSGAFAGGRGSREAERGERPDRGGRAGHAGKPPSDARGSGGRRYRNGFGGGTDPRPRPRNRPQPGQGPRCWATGAEYGGGRHNLKAAELRMQNGCRVFQVECFGWGRTRQKLRPHVCYRLPRVCYIYGGGLQGLD